MDISKHTQLYKSVLLQVLAIASNPLTHPLLQLHIYESGDKTVQLDNEQHMTLSTLIKKLSEVAQIYTKTVG